MKAKVVDHVTPKSLLASDYIMQPPRNDHGGHISKEHTVWCGRCNVWHQESSNSIKKMEQIIKRSGWKKHRYYGWCCPDCLQEIKDGRTDIGYRRSTYGG